MGSGHGGRQGALVVQIFGETAEEKKARGDYVSLLQLNEILDGFGDGWGTEFGSEAGVVGLIEFSQQASGFDDESESACEQKHNGCNLVQDAGSRPTNDTGPINDF